MSGRSDGRRIRWADGGPFAIVPEWLLDARVPIRDRATREPNGETRPVSDRAVRLFAVFARHADGTGEATPSRKTLAARLDCSLSSLDAALDDLVAAGAVTVEPRRRGDGSLTSNTYTLHATPRSNFQGRSTDGSVEGSTDGSVDKERDVLGTRNERATALSQDRPDPRKPPPLVKVDGRSPVWDSLVEHCDADPDARSSEIGKAARDVAGLTWRALTDEARATFAAGDPAAWPTFVAGEVERRAALYKRAFSADVECTPRALAKWWNDIERKAVRARGGRLTAAELAALSRDAP